MLRRRNWGSVVLPQPMSSLRWFSRERERMSLSVQDVDIPQGNLLGKEGEGFKIAMEILDAGRIPVAAQASAQC